MMRGKRERDEDGRRRFSSENFFFFFFIPFSVGLLNHLKTNKTDASPYLKLTLVALLILSLRATIDHFSLWPFMIAFGFGAFFMFLLLLAGIAFYGYLNLDYFLGEETFGRSEVTVGHRLYQEECSLPRVPSIVAQSKRDELLDVEMKGRLVVQLEGNQEDAQRGLVELKGQTLFVHSLNGLPKVQAVVIGGSYLRVLNDTTIELFHPWKSFFFRDKIPKDKRNAKQETSSTRL
eukprot:TRINITY_DN20794_c0_g1_i1.p1 TRINITY_DN20794_c0_g1~~TRINITY_DN20794_c0_g1_i1.p1  ORF type:complete len:234 (-),score=53.67 TRINITY_DN20794_c0_g1_i1:208-909(-)